MFCVFFIFGGLLCVFWHSFRPTFIFVVAHNCSTASVLGFQLSLKRTILYFGHVQFCVYSLTISYHIFLHNFGLCVTHMLLFCCYT
jgi:hypothetical protein